MPEGVRQHIFQFAGGVEGNISETCRLGHTYATRKIGELSSLPDGVRQHIFQFAGGEEGNISHTCRLARAYASPLLSAAKQAIDQVHDVDGEIKEDQPNLDQALDRLELHADFEAVRSMLCSFGRISFANCYWFHDVYEKRAEMNKSH